MNCTVQSGQFSVVDQSRDRLPQDKQSGATLEPPLPAEVLDLLLPFHETINLVFLHHIRDTQKWLCTQKAVTRHSHIGLPLYKAAANPITV